MGKQGEAYLHFLDGLCVLALEKTKKQRGKQGDFFGAPLFKMNKAEHAGSVIPGQLIVTCPGGGAREISRAEQGEFQGRGRSQKGERRG